MSAASDHARLPHLLNELGVDVDILREVVPVTAYGLYPDGLPVIDNDPAAQANARAEFERVQRHCPQFMPTYEVAGRRVYTTRDQPDYSLLVPTDTDGVWQLRPVLLVVPQTIPTVGGTPLTKYPTIRARVGDSLWLRCTYALRRGYTLTTGNAEIIASADELSLGNTNVIMPGQTGDPVTTTRYDLLGIITAAGVGPPASNPFNPFEI